MLLENKYICKMKIKINGIEYNIPLSWGEVNYSQAIKVIENVDDKAKQLNALTLIPLDVINGLTDQQAQSLFNLISFTENLEVFENDNILELAKDFDFANVTYGVSEKCRNILKSEQTGFTATIGIIKLLKDIDISEMPFLEVIGTANFFLTKSIIFLIATPSCTNLKQALNKSKQVLTDSIALEALQRTLNSQSVEL